MLTFNELKKQIKNNRDEFKKIKLAILSDSATQFLVQAIKGYGIVNKINFDIYEADYNQIDLQVFDTSSELYTFKPEFVVIFRSSEKAVKSFYKISATQQQNFAVDDINYLQSIYSAIQTHLDAKIITNTFFEINDGVFGNYATKINQSFVYQIKKLNLQLMEVCQNSPNLFLIDLASLIATVGYQNVFDTKMYINADMNFGIDILPLIAKNVTDIILSISGSFKKCIILDLDNTTWGGVIGDDGVEGIQIGDLGIGKAFTELQLWIKQLINRGIILAVCSKNTESIAKEPFINHPDMVLKLDDVAVFVANWENKVDNIKHIQNILNISFDSMVFLDDNPFEREMVKQSIENICVPTLPEDPTEYLTYLRSLNLFETASFTQADNERTKQYQVEAKRFILQKSFSNENDYLASLEMKSDVKAFNKYTIPRVAQLSQRSNQFNLRTIRYTEQDIEKLANNTTYITLSFTLSDNYGDNGLISMVILKNLGNSLFIDTWIMSCRVLKRTMEIFVLNKIVEIAKQNKIETIIGEYIPTLKNTLVKEHYNDLGFTKTDNNLYKLDVPTYNYKTSFITETN